MIKPRQHVVHLIDCRDLRQCRPPQKNHGQMKHARGSDLGIARSAAAVLRDHHFNPMLREQGALGCFVEWTPRRDIGGVRHGERDGDSKIRVCCKPRREATRLRRAAENEDASHGDC